MSVKSINKVDICCGLAWGDEAKGKIVSQLAKSNDYNFVCRWNGGNNAGHTVYVNKKKYKTHLIPSGVFYNVKSIIGPDCVVNIKSFFEEIEYLKNNGFNTELIKISPKAHIITDEHIKQDINELSKQQGTTKRGIAPCYSDKYRRVGLQAKKCVELKPYLWNEELYGNILCEGAQGFWLDINEGNYPYTTSSVTLPYSACSLGFSPRLINNIYGAVKIYDTRSGVDPEFPEDLLNNDELNQIGEKGEEYGVTTNRRRKVNWLNLNKLIYAINTTGVNIIIISKIDILEMINVFKLYYCHVIITFNNMNEMKKYIELKINEKCNNISSIEFSNNPYIINEEVSCRIGSH
jgi:adenylosuccinate synthase